MIKRAKRKLLPFLAIVFLLSHYSCEEFINEINIENDQIDLVAPFNGANLSEGVIQFDWLSLEGASSYHIQVAQPNFQIPEQIIWDEVVQDSIGTNTSVDLSAGTYQWRVRGENSAYSSPYTTYNLEIN